MKKKVSIRKRIVILTTLIVALAMLILSILSEAASYRSVTPQSNRSYSNNVDLRCHPTQKPVELLEYLIKTFSNEEDVVLDLIMCSGSTDVACKNLNRKFIGIELDKEYFEIAQARIVRCN